MKTFEEIITRPEFKTLSQAELIDTRDYYFDKYVAPSVDPQRVQDAKIEFDAYANRFIGETEGMDYLKAPLSGAASGASFLVKGAGEIMKTGGEGVRRGVNAVFGTELPPAVNPLDSVSESIGSVSDDLRGTISPRGQQLMQDSTATGNIFKGEGSFGEDPSVEGYALNTLNFVGQQIPILLGAAPFGVAATATGQMARGAGVAAVLGGGAAASEEGGRIRNMTPEQLAELPAYQAMLEEGLSPQQAKDDLQKLVETMSFWTTAPISAASGVIAGGLMSHGGQRAISRMVGESTVKRMFAGGVTGAAGEGVQEPMEGVAQRFGSQLATGEDRELGEGTFGEAVMGALGGGVPGIAGGLVKPAEAFVPPADRPAYDTSDPLQPPQIGADSPAITSERAEWAAPEKPVAPSGEPIRLPDGTTITKTALEGEAEALIKAGFAKEAEQIKRFLSETTYKTGEAGNDAIDTSFWQSIAKDGLPEFDYAPQAQAEITPPNITDPNLQESRSPQIDTNFWAEVAKQDLPEYDLTQAVDLTDPVESAVMDQTYFRNQPTAEAPIRETVAEKIDEAPPTAMAGAFAKALQTPQKPAKIDTQFWSAVAKEIETEMKTEPVNESAVPTSPAGLSPSAPQGAVDSPLNPPSAAPVEPAASPQALSSMAEGDSIQADLPSVDTVTATSGEKRYFRETSPSEADVFIPGSNTISSNPFGGIEVFASDNRDLALGQGGNKGVVLEFSGNNLAAKRQRTKPGAAISNGSEILLSSANHQAFRDNLMSVTIKKDAKNWSSPGEYRRTLNTLDRLHKDKGWSRTETPDGVKYEKQQDATQADLPSVDTVTAPSEMATQAPQEPTNAVQIQEASQDNASSLPRQGIRRKGKDTAEGGVRVREGGQAQEADPITKALREQRNKYDYLSWLSGRLGRAEFVKQRDKIEQAWERERGGQPKLSRNDTWERKTSNVSMAVNDVVKNWKHIPDRIRVIQSVNDLPKHLVDYVKSQNAESDAAGLYDARTSHIYLVADNLKSEEHAQKVFLHETFGHYGFAAIAPEDQRVPLLNAVYEARRDHVREIAKRYGLNLLTQRGRLEAAEEVLAHMAEDGDISSVFTRVLSTVKQWIRKYFPNLKMSDAEIRGLLGRMGRAAKTKTPKTSKVEPPAIAHASMKRGEAMFSLNSSPDDKVASDIRGITQTLKDVFSGVKGEADGKKIIHQVEQNFNLWDRTVGTMRHIVKRNQDHPTEGHKLKSFFDADEAFAMDRDKILMAGQLPLNAMTSLPKKEQVLLTTALHEGTLFENDNGSQGTVWSDAELKKRGLTDKGVASYKIVRKYYDESTIEYANRIIGRTGADPLIIRQGSTAQKEAEKKRIGTLKFNLANKIYGDFKALKGYFPVMRFGRYTLAVYDMRPQTIAKILKEEGVNNVSDFMKKERREAYEAQLGKGKYDELMSVVRFGDLARFEMFETRIGRASRAGQVRREYGDGFQVKTGKLDAHVDEEIISDLRILKMLQQYQEIDKDILDEVEQKILKSFSDASFKKRFIHRKGVPGYSKDGVRTIARYAQSSAHFLTKLRNIPIMREIAESIDKKVMPDIRDHLLGQIADMEKPGIRMARFKQLTFLAYMGFNVKSALVNFTQVPIVLYPKLAQKYGDIAASKAIAKAMKVAALQKYSDPKLAEIMNWADQSGLTWDQFLGELSGYSKGKGAARVIVEHKTMEYATSLFSLVEQYNRRIAAAAEYYANPKRSIAELQDAVKNTIYDTQWLYGKGNQGKWFRSWGGVPLQFQQWIVQYLEFLSKSLTTKGERGAALRSLGILFLFGGLFSLPGTDDFKEVIQFLSNKFGKNIDIEMLAREQLVEIFDRMMDDESARKWAEHFLRGHGAWLPGDIGGSISTSRLIPGFSETLRTASTEGFLEAAKKLPFEIAGPGVGVITRMVREVDQAERSGDYARLIEATPIVAVANALKSWRWAQDGVDRDYAGKIRISYEPDKVDTILMALSVQPSERSRLYRIRSAEQREGAFVEMVHDNLLTRLAVSTVDKDTEKKRAAMRLIEEWNRESPPEWKLTGQKIMRSMRARRKNMSITDDTGVGNRMKQLQPRFREQRELYQE